MEREGGNGERIRKWRKREEIEREWGNVESQSLSISSFPLHFPILPPFPSSQDARMPGCHNLCNPVCWLCFLSFNILNMTSTDGWIQNFTKKRHNSLKKQYVWTCTQTSHYAYSGFWPILAYFCPKVLRLFWAHFFIFEHINMKLSGINQHC